MYLENGRIEAAVNICEKLSQSGVSDFDRQADNQIAGGAYLAIGEAKLIILTQWRRFLFLNKLCAIWPRRKSTPFVGRCAVGSRS